MVRLCKRMSSVEILLSVVVETIVSMITVRLESLVSMFVIVLVPLGV